MSLAARITFFTRRGAQSGSFALPWTIFALPQLPLSVSPDPVVWVPPPDPDTEVPPPPAVAGATGRAISAAAAVRPAAKPIRVLDFPRLKRTCVGVCKITSLLRRPAGLAVGLALKEPAPPPRWVRPNRWFPRSPPEVRRGFGVYRLSMARHVTPSAGHFLHIKLTVSPRKAKSLQIGLNRARHFPGKH